MLTVGTAAYVAATVAALTAYTVVQSSGWSRRGIIPALPWPVMYALQGAAAFLAATYIEPVWGTGPAVSAAAFGWLGVLAVGTDIKTYKVPWDISHPAAAIGLTCFMLNYTFEGLLALLAALLGAVGVPLVARWLTRKGLGMSDIRLLWAAVATCSWWVGQTWLLYALLLAALVQTVIRLAAPTLGLGRREGADVSLPSRQSTLAVTPSATQQAATTGRLELPFAPALIGSLVALIGYGTHLAYGACLMWNPFGNC